MAKHIYIANTDGGYFYRVYPKLTRLQFPHIEKSIQRDLFNPPPVVATHSIIYDIYGRYIQKFNDKGLTIELNQKCTFLMLDHNTKTQEQRILESKVYLVVPENIYNYPFIENRIYSLNIHEVNDITP